LLIPILFAMSNCNRSSSPLVKTDQYVPNILTPQNVFQTSHIKGMGLKNPRLKHGKYFEKKYFHIDFKKTNPFQWRFSEAIPQGTLKFSVYFANLSINDPKQQILDQANISIIVVQKKQKSNHTLIKEEISLEPLKIGSFEQMVERKFSQAISLKKGDQLFFFLRLNGELPQSFEYGISIPRVIKERGRGSFKSAANIILISIDTLRSDYVGIYQKLAGKQIGMSYSPNIDAFSETAAVFKNCYSPVSATWQALTSMFLSLYPTQHGVYGNGEYMKYKYYSIASFLLNLGYRTLSFNSNSYLLNLAGFEERYNFFKRDFALIKFAMEKIRENPINEPYFHWYHFLGVHANYTPPKWVMDRIEKEDKRYRIYNLNRVMKGLDQYSDQDIRYIRKLYAGELYRLDIELKKLFDFLKGRGQWDNSLIILTADHGEDLYQHHKNFYHYPSIYNTALKIPLMIKFPYQKERIVVSELVSLIDIFPTISHFLKGEKYLKKNKIPSAGQSLLPLISGNKGGFTKRILYAGVDNYRVVSAQQQNWRLIYNPEEITPLTQVKLKYPLKKIEFYDLNKDPLEQQLILKNRMIGFLIDQIFKFKKNHPLLQPEDLLKANKINEATLKQTRKVLKTLGYIE